MKQIIICLLFFVARVFVWNGAGASPATTTDYAATTLQSSRLKVILYLPDAQKGYYRGTRFDWSGLISKVEFGRHSFFCEFKQEHDPLNHDDICGTAEEFGIESAPSYAQALPGEPFIKIGIGVLERANRDEYKFWQRYKVLTPGEWKIKQEPGRIEFRQSVNGPKGWGYEFIKVIQLASDAPSFKIIRRLTNTGSQTIDTDHYDHNFLRIDNTRAGTNYSLEFPFQPRFGPDSQTQGCLEIKGHSMVLTHELAPDKSIWVRLEGFQNEQDNEVKVINHLTGATLSIIGDQPLSKVVYYSSGGVLCPEPFVKVTVLPGQTREWSTTYRFAEGTHDETPNSRSRHRTLIQAQQEGYLMKADGNIDGTRR
jgi:hypothetical protein